ncbi:EARP-interacting protein homolog [Schistocerca cancellata]|uniref:EARP-interacting protein homolog n=1 Tax=Schistocerca cancellata TaxID=274614 RepID=UPI002118B643|nr:EARP-interacting protein homolog [Schistocerca cancellata]
MGQNNVDDDAPVIYGLEFQARALASQVAESDNVRFMVGTQSIKFSHNQVHIIEVNEENGALSTEVYQHAEGEVWSLTASPADANVIATCYNTLNEDTCCMRTALWKIPFKNTSATGTGDQLAPALELLCNFDTEQYGKEVKVTDFHPTDGKRAVTVVDNQFVVWDIAESSSKMVSVGMLEGKGQPRFTTGKWNPHHNCTQFVTVNDSHIRSWDLRAGLQQVWAIEGAHSQLIRDLDFNPNKQYYLATCGDDGCSKFWDVRNAAEPVISRSDHSHWVWSIRYNHFHDQLVLTSSSDSRVILTSVASISSEPFGHLPDEEEAENAHREKLEDGVLATYDEHEDSVYRVEWSAADPWTFASLSYDGRLVISKVPRSVKYKILL